MVAGAGLATAGASLVVRSGFHWCRTGSCLFRQVVAGAGLLVACSGLVAAVAGLGGRRCRKVAAATEKWSPVQHL